MSDASLEAVDLLVPELAAGDRGHLRLPLLAAAVPHWFDARYLSALPDIANGENGMLLDELRGLAMVEPRDEDGAGALRITEPARTGLREHLRTKDPDRWTALAAHAQAWLALEPSSLHTRMEGLYHLFVTDPETGATECDALEEEYILAGRQKELTPLISTLGELTEAGWLSGMPFVKARLIVLWSRFQAAGVATLEEPARELLALAREFPDSWQAASARCLHADTLAARGDVEGAMAGYEESRRILLQLITGNPARAARRRSLGFVYSREGVIHLDRKETEAAFQAFSHELELLLGLEREAFPDVTLPDSISRVHMHLAGIHELQGRIPEAFASRAEALSVLERHPAAPGSGEDRDNTMAVIHIRTGELHARQNAREAAVASFQEAIRLLRKLPAEDSQWKNWRMTLFHILCRTGNLHREMGRHGEALEALQESLRIIKESRDPESRVHTLDLATVHCDIGEVHLAGGRTDQALDAYSTALTFYNDAQTPGLSSPDSVTTDLGTLQYRIGEIHEDEGRTGDALHAYAETIRLLGSPGPSDSSDI